VSLVFGSVRVVLFAAVLFAATNLRAEIHLVERAAEVGLDFVHFNGMSGALYFVEMVGSGAALVDYDGDGDLDLYAVQGAWLGESSLETAVFPPSHPLPLTDRLYRNDLHLGEDGRPRLVFADVTERAAVEASGYGQGVTAGDFDNDGWPDLYLANFGRNELLHNEGDGTFSRRDVAPGADSDWSVSAAAVDYDADGWLDLYVANYVDYRLATHKQCRSDVGTKDYCGPLAYPPREDLLYRNRGDGSFEDVSTASGIAIRPGSTLGVVSGDFNRDGLLDLYAANDQMANFLWMNQGDGTFVDEAVLAGAAVNAAGQPEASMGVVAGDFDGDGSEDLVVTHLMRETNTLYLNDGGGFFFDATQGSGLDRSSFRVTGFGIAAADFDLDGWADLFVANGEVRRIEEQVRQAEPHPLRQPNLLLRNDGGTFSEVGYEAPEAAPEVSRGVAVGDLDNDGDPDLVMTNNAGPIRLFLNEGEASDEWVGVRALSGVRDALGATVTVEMGSGRRVDRVRTDGSYVSARDPRVVLAVGEETVDRMRLDWPGGGVSIWRSPSAGSYRVVSRPGDVP